MDEQSIRINRFLAESGHYSRRRADELVAQGRVTVDGRRCEMGELDAEIGRQFDPRRLFKVQLVVDPVIGRTGGTIEQAIHADQFSHPWPGAQGINIFKLIARRIIGPPSAVHHQHVLTGNLEAQHRVVERIGASERVGQPVPAPRQRFGTRRTMQMDKIAKRAG